MKPFRHPLPYLTTLLLLAFHCLPEQAIAKTTQEVPLNIRHAVERAIDGVKPSLVRIQVVSTRYRQGREIKRQSVGSGVIITSEGHLVTNHHVAGHGIRFFCTLADLENIEAELVGTDPLTDIAVLKLKPDEPREFPYVAWGNSDTVKVGDHVLAMGSPMALSQSVTLGIVSNTEMVMPKFFGPYGRVTMDGEDVGSLVRWIGHDAAIYGGNSGGPLINLEGEIVGINEISIGLGGAIPGNLARQVSRQLMEHGRVPRAWLGLDVQPLLKHAKPKTGLLVSGVIERSPAAEAGFQAGDILLSLDGTPVTVQYEEEMPEFSRLVADLPIGVPVNAVVQREGHEKTLELVTAKREDYQPQQYELKEWGLTVQNISFLMARELKRDTADGALVTSVRPGGPAGNAKPSINEKDILVKAGSTIIKNVKDLQEFTREFRAEETKPQPLLTTFERKEGRYLTVVVVGIEELKDPGLEVSKAWLPVETQVITRDIARQLNQPQLKGFIVTHVYTGSSAETAGLQVGDFLVRFDGEPLVASAPEHYEELGYLVRQYPIGSNVQLGMIRDGQSQSVEVELVRSPKLKREMKHYRNEDFEFTVRNVSFFDKAEEQWEERVNGVLVEEVRSGGWAELGGLYVNDLILAADGASVGDIEELRGRMERIAEQRPDYVVLKVLRGIHTLFLELQPDWNQNR